MRKEAQAFDHWFRGKHELNGLTVLFCQITLTQSYLTYTLTVLGDLAEPTGIPAGSEAFLYSRTLTYDNIVTRSYCNQTQRLFTQCVKGLAYTTFVYVIHHKDLDS